MNQFQLLVPEYRRKGFPLLSHAFSLFTKNMLPIFALVAILTLPAEVIKYYFVDESWNARGFFSSTTGMDAIIQLIFLSVVSLMVVYYILGRLTGENVGLKQSIKFGIRKWPKILIYGFLQNAIISAGLILFVIPGILCAVWLMLLPVIVAVTDTSRTNPLEICREMARRRFFKFAGYAIGGGAITGLVLVPGIGIAALLPTQSVIVNLVLDLYINFAFQFFVIVLLLVFLQVNTEWNDDALVSENPRE